MPHTLTGTCDSCLMPFKQDPLGENRESAQYCSYCFKDGSLVYEGDDVNEFKKKMIEAIVARGESRLLAWVFAFMAGFAPRWKKPKETL